ncbi:MAG: dNTP triphosphohydrolase [Ignavibacteria bacterium]|jgi:dGTPase|nr:dNTP triphosphohydrolase [Ignavibacteria bacterium]
MKNKFYTQFDTERLKQNSRDDDYRSPFQIDRDRIIHSSEFRRLQGKTQVFLPGEYDFYRTRLTHSIEVAQIGRSISTFLYSKEKEILNKEYFIDEDLVESICLAHDLGHPPFGHAGERKLNELMKKYGGFEGNAQTLRLIADIFYRDNDHHRGMNPTRAFLDGILKYKASFKEFKNPENHFIYDEQKKYIDFVFAGSSIPKNISRPDKINSFRSIECQIMDWADDTAYAINDLVDSISGGFITIPKLIQWKEEKAQSDFQKQIIDEIIEWITKSIFKKKFGAQIGVFVSACGLREEKNFMSGSTNRYKYSLTIKDDILERAKVYKTISVDLVFRSSQLHQIEYKGNLMIEQLFDLFFTNYVNNAKGIKLLPDFNDQILNSEKTTKRRARLICDYIAGATDGYAMRLYRRMFDPDYSSISDLV